MLAGKLEAVGVVAAVLVAGVAVGVGVRMGSDAGVLTACVKFEGVECGVVEKTSDGRVTNVLGVVTQVGDGYFDLEVRTRSGRTVKQRVGYLSFAPEIAIASVRDGDWLSDRFSWETRVVAGNSLKSEVKVGEEVVVMVSLPSREREKEMTSKERSCLGYTQMWIRRLEGSGEWWHVFPLAWGKYVQRCNILTSQIYI